MLGRLKSIFSFIDVARLLNSIFFMYKFYSFISFDLNPSIYLKSYWCDYNLFCVLSPSRSLLNSVFSMYKFYFYKISFILNPSIYVKSCWIDYNLFCVLSPSRSLLNSLFFMYKYYLSIIFILNLTIYVKSF